MVKKKKLKRKCIRCSKSFIGVDNSKYCDKCKIKVAREQKKKADNNRKEIINLQRKIIYLKKKLKKEYRRQYREKNREKIIKKSREDYKKNRKKILKKQKEEYVRISIGGFESKVFTNGATEEIKKQLPEIKRKVFEDAIKNISKYLKKSRKNV